MESVVQTWISSYVSSNWRTVLAGSPKGRKILGRVEKYVNRMKHFLSGKTSRLGGDFDGDGVTNYSYSYAKPDVKVNWET